MREAIPRRLVVFQFLKNLFLKPFRRCIEPKALPATLMSWDLVQFDWNLDCFLPGGTEVLTTSRRVRPGRADSEDRQLELF